MTDIALLGVFFAVALLHAWAENHTHKLATGWLMILAHPAVLAGLKDWGIRIAVYSKWALLGVH